MALSFNTADPVSRDSTRYLCDTVVGEGIFSVSYPDMTFCPVPVPDRPHTDTGTSPVGWYTPRDHRCLACPHTRLHLGNGDTRTHIDYYCLQ